MLVSSASSASGPSACAVYRLARLSPLWGTVSSAVLSAVPSGIPGAVSTVVSGTVLCVVSSAVRALF